jgi:hypothetical protein
LFKEKISVEGVELELFVRGAKINIIRYNIYLVVIVKTGRVKIS